MDTKLIGKNRRISERSIFIDFIDEGGNLNKKSIVEKH